MSNKVHALPIPTHGVGEVHSHQDRASLDTDKVVLEAPHVALVQGRSLSGKCTFPIWTGRSLFLFSYRNPFRQLCIKGVSTSMRFDLFIIVVILANCVFMALTEPIPTAEYVFSGIYTLELVAKVVALGFIFHKHAYLRDAWNWLDFVVVIAGYLALVPAFGNYSAIRAFRVFRALRAITVLPGLRRMVNSLISAVKSLFGVMVVVFFTLLFFATFSLQLFSGVLRNKCIATPPANISDTDYYSFITNSSHWIEDRLCGNSSSARSCPTGFTCIGGLTPNPNFDITSFDNIGRSALTTFQLMTLDFWEDVYDKVMASAGKWTMFYFLIIVFFGCFYVINLILATVAIAYAHPDEAAVDEDSTSIVPGHEQSKQTLPLVDCRADKSDEDDAEETLLGVIGQDDEGEVGTGDQSEDDGRDDSVEMENIVSDLEPQTPAAHTACTRASTTTSSSPVASKPKKKRVRVRVTGPKWWRRTRRFFFKISVAKWFKNSVITVIVLNTITLALYYPAMNPSFEFALQAANYVWTAVFIIEAIIKLLGLSKHYFYDWWNIFDFVIVLVSIIELILDIAKVDGPGGLSVMRTFRLLRVFRLARSWSTLHALASIIARSFSALSNLTLVLILVIYIFAVVGMQLFQTGYVPENFEGGEVPRWNFRDFFHSFLLIFRVLCGEWIEPLWDTVQAAGYGAVAFYVLAIVVGNFVLLNLFLALLLSAFDSQSLERARKERKHQQKVVAEMLTLHHRRRSSLMPAKGQESLPRRLSDIAWGDTASLSGSQHLRRVRTISTSTVHSAFSTTSDQSLMSGPHTARKRLSLQVPEHHIQAMRHGRSDSPYSPMLTAPLSSSTGGATSTSSLASNVGQFSDTKLKEDHGKEHGQRRIRDQPNPDSAVDVTQHLTKLSKDPSEVTFKRATLSLQRNALAPLGVLSAPRPTRSSLFHHEVHTPSTLKRPSSTSATLGRGSVPIPTSLPSLSEPHASQSPEATGEQQQKGDQQRGSSGRQRIHGSLSPLSQTPGSTAHVAAPLPQPSSFNSSHLLINSAPTTPEQSPNISPRSSLRGSPFGSPQLLRASRQGSPSAFGAVQQALQLISTSVNGEERLSSSPRHHPAELAETEGSEDEMEEEWLGVGQPLRIASRAASNIELPRLESSLSEGELGKDKGEEKGQWKGKDQDTDLTSAISSPIARKKVLSLPAPPIVVSMEDQDHDYSGSNCTTSGGEQSQGVPPEKWQHTQPDTDRKPFQQEVMFETEVDGESVPVTGHSCWARFRRKSYRMVTHSYFEAFIIVMIVWSSAMLALEDARLPSRPTLAQALFYCDIVFSVVFGLELILKLIGLGPKGYFSSGWNVIDFVVVVVSIVSLAAINSNLGALRAVRTLRALRPLRAISRWENMRVVVNSLLYSIPAIANVLLVCGLIWLIFSIMGVEFFGGKFSLCVDGNGDPFDATVIPNKTTCLNTTDALWYTPTVNFDNVLNAFVSLLQVATFEGWMEIMAAASDITGVDQQPVFEANFAANYFFVLFIIMGSFFTLNLFVGVIIDSFNRLKQQFEAEGRGIFLTAWQRQYLETLKSMAHQKPQKKPVRPEWRLGAWCYDIAETAWFEVTILVLIGLNMVALMLEHYDATQGFQMAALIINIVFTCLFLLEAILKLLAYKLHYFSSGWNTFDFSIVVVSVVGMVFDLVSTSFPISPTILRVLRILRVVRILRVIRAAQGIRDLLLTLLLTLPALFNVATLLFLIMFIFAILGMSAFGNVVENGTITEFANFRTFGNAMILLFRVSTSAGWNDVLESVAVQPPFCDQTYNDLPNGNCGNRIVAQVYFSSFVVLAFLIIINMYIAVILENLSMISAREGITITSDDIDKFYARWALYDPAATQLIQYDLLFAFVGGVATPLGFESVTAHDINALDIPLVQGDMVHCLDVLHALVRRQIIGNTDLEIAPHELELLETMARDRFERAFPLRKSLVVASTTQQRVREVRAAILIQRFYRRILARRMRDQGSFIALAGQPSFMQGLELVEGTAC
eukprot:m.261974 g.261974  ORF g.261974 m.261974 type:complete len:2012 (+) comp15585_c0_seq2:444-6479(+)